LVCRKFLKEREKLKFRLLSAVCCLTLLSSGCGKDSGKKTDENATETSSTVRGTILDTRQTPISRAQISLTSAQQPPLILFSDPWGKFEAKIESGKHDIIVEIDGISIFKTSFSAATGKTVDLGVLRPAKPYYAAGAFWYKDVDGDGYSDGEKVRKKYRPEGHKTPAELKDKTGDCNDYDSKIFPGAKEILGDGVDQNCDGSDSQGTAYYRDADGDGHGQPGSMILALEKPEGYVLSDKDCDDSAASVYPGAKEILSDGIDQDCDGGDTIGTTYYLDSDSDGYGDDAKTMLALSLPEGYASRGKDCDDENSKINPEAEEVLNDGVDQDCDGADQKGTAYFIDKDGDGFGDAIDAVLALSAPEGYVVDNTDCNDMVASVHPGAEETLSDGIDQDCDGSDKEGIVFYRDADADGFGDAAETIAALSVPKGYVVDSADCDDGNPAVHPGAEETLSDGIDQDCDGSDKEGTVFYRDADADGFGDATETIAALSAPKGYVVDSSDCDDGNPAVHPGAEEILNDETDQDCDGEAQKRTSPFVDENFEACIRKNLKIKEGKIPEEKLAGIDVLECKRRNVESLKGAELLINLEWIFLQENRISNLSPLSKLKKLERIYLQDNRVSDVSPLAGLMNLELLNIRDNNVRDVSPLSGLPELAALDLWGNAVSDLSPLAKLAKLRQLDLWKNNVTDISPLAGLTSLETLSLGENAIRDLSMLQRLGNLKILSIRKNKIADLSPLSHLSNLNSIYLGENCISDFSPVKNVESIQGMESQRTSCSD